MVCTVLPPKIRASGLLGKNHKLATDYEKSRSGLRGWIPW
jgi:RNase P/RNase MRP subunit p29